jgi:vitellogenic carboxypeptidase-like protein/serine carboxypeptidase-like clade 4
VASLQYYDVRKECEGSLCYDFSNLEKFFGDKAVKEALGVGDIEFVSCSSSVYEAMLTDWMRNLEVGIPALLEDGINVLIYAGEYDLICNWLGKDAACPIILFVYLFLHHNYGKAFSVVITAYLSIFCRPY